MSSGPDYFDLDSESASSASIANGHLEEYRTLRDEILRRFTFRLLSVGYSNAAVGC